MNYLNLIYSWHKKASKEAQEKEYFTAYVFEYLSFICFIVTQLQLDKDITDGDHIEKFKKNNSQKKFI